MAADARGLKADIMVVWRSLRVVEGEEKNEGEW
jgi:hypothetical protein